MRCPTIPSRTHRWENGYIVNKASGNANFSIYEASFHNRLFEELECRLGPTISRIVYIAGRHAAAAIAEELFSARPAVQKLLFGTPLHRWTQRSLIRFAGAIGMGRIELLEHRKGKAGAVRVTNPFHLAYCTAVILGGLDVMYGFPVAFTALAEGESYVGELVSGERDSLGSEEAYPRLTSEKLIPSKRNGERSLPACRRCGVPVDLGSLFTFDLEGGVIVERKTGDRHIFYGHQSLNAILREFERELGPEVKDFSCRRKRTISPPSSPDIPGKTDYGKRRTFAAISPSEAWASSPAWRKMRGRPFGDLQRVYSTRSDRAAGCLMGARDRKTGVFRIPVERKCLATEDHPCDINLLRV